MPRKLTAILLADVVAYSRLMELDETGTLARLKEHRRCLVDPAIKAHHGRIVKLMGDGMLVEFPSVVEAVACAVEIQDGMSERNFSSPESDQIKLRIGINIGDVIVEGEDIYGDGVNIAARLEALAQPGGICISGMVYDALGKKLPLKFESIGEQTVKNISQAVRVYRVCMEAGSNLPETRLTEKSFRMSWRSIVLAGIILFALIIGGITLLKSGLPEPELAATDLVAETKLDSLSIAVLPFANMSGDPEQEYFSDGITEDIITALSGLSSLAVIARTSSFSYKGSSVKVQKIGQDLGVRYILEGSIRRSGNRIRITAQLVDAVNGHHLWAERYDRDFTEIFALQDEITGQIVRALSIKLSENDERDISQGNTDNIEAYDLFLQGQIFANSFTEEGGIQAIERYQQAISIDPGFARAYGALAVVLTRQITRGFVKSNAETIELALEAAHKAVSIAPESPQVLWAMGFVYMYNKEFDKAIEVLEKSISIAPSYADGYGLLALINNNLGHANIAIDYIDKAMSLNPFFSWQYLNTLGRAYYALGEYEKAILYLQQALERNPAVTHPRLYLAASYVQLGQLDDAEWVITELELRNPEYTISNLQRSLPIDDKNLLARLLADLITAGMAE